MTQSAVLTCDHRAIRFHCIGRLAKQYDGCEPVAHFTGKAMKLRDHPLMYYRGVPNWPPVWAAKSNDSLKGEIGILKKVNRDIKTINRCFLLIEHNNREYTGTLLFNDGMFCWLMSVLLKKHIGMSIKAIGDLDLSYTL